MRKTSAEEKKLKGTLQSCREPKGSEMEVLRTSPRAPGYLSEAAAEEWRRVAPEAVRVGVTQADMRALALLCEALATESALRAVIQQEGTTIEAGSGGRKAHPALAALAQSRHQAHQLLANFGLIPRSRVSMPAKPAPAKTNAFDRFKEFRPK